MVIFNDLKSINISEDTVVSIGKFDGTHVGHQKIFKEMQKIKESSGLKMALFCIENFNGENISNSLDRRVFFENEGVDYLAKVNLFDGVSEISAEDFVINILVNKMHMKAVVAGEDLRFGHNRDGNAEYMISLSQEYGYDVYIIDKVKDSDGVVISSTEIRNLVKETNVSKAAALLGDFYTITGTVKEGNHIGKNELGYPTVNLYPDENKLLPGDGVYSTIVRYNGKEYKSITNVGTNPTVVNDELNHIRRIETFILDFNETIYEKEIKIDFVDFIRPQKKFDSLKDLKNQIDIDITKL